MKIIILLILLIDFCKVSTQITITADDNVLSLNIPGSQYIETRHFNKIDDSLIVEGYINTYYPDNMASLTVNYVADKYGYRASYIFMKSLPPSEISFTTRLSANTLKSAAG